MGILTAIGLAVFISIALYFYKKKASLMLIKELGFLALVIGIFGQLIGLFEAFKAIEGMEVQVSTAIIVGGLKVSMITTLYGMLIFILTRIFSLAVVKMQSA